MATIKEHCWHGASRGGSLAPWPGGFIEKCCWCGALRRTDMTRQPDPTHGPMLDRYYTDKLVPVVTGGDGLCVERSITVESSAS